MVYIRLQKLIRGIILTGFICTFALASCREKTISAEDNLPELPFSQDLLSAIEEVLSSYPQDELGISAAVLAPGYRVWASASGYSQPGIPTTNDMLFNVGSIAKNFEAALLLKLVEEGVLSLDDPVSMYLPAYPNVDGSITIRQLLDHTSGIFNVFEHPDFPWVRTDVDYAKEWQAQEVFENFVLAPYGPPGYAQHYSSTNYLLLTMIIEEASGSSAPDGIEHYFLEPMKLEHTFVSMGKLPPAKYSVAHPWVDIDQDGILEDLFGIPLTWIASLTHPVMFSTPQDLTHWMQALYHGSTVLSPDSLGEMLTYPKVTLRDPDGAVYGLGVVDYTDILGVKVLGHGGSALGYSAAALYLPDYGFSVAWLINTGESPPELADRLMGDTWSALSDVILNHVGPADGAIVTPMITGFYHNPP
jgi:D-alanyl-D-alanine carboxypeptidase